MPYCRAVTTRSGRLRRTLHGQRRRLAPAGCGIARCSPAGRRDRRGSGTTVDRAGGAVHHAGDALAMPLPQPGRGLWPGRRHHDSQGDLCQRNGRGRRTNMARLEDRRPGKDPAGRVAHRQSARGAAVGHALPDLRRRATHVGPNLPHPSVGRGDSTRCWASTAQSGSGNCRSSTPKRRPGRILQMFEIETSIAARVEFARPSTAQRVEQHEDATP